MLVRRRINFDATLIQEVTGNITSFHYRQDSFFQENGPITVYITETILIDGEHHNIKIYIPEVSRLIYFIRVTNEETNLYI